MRNRILIKFFYCFYIYILFVSTVYSQSFNKDKIEYRDGGVNLLNVSTEYLLPHTNDDKRDADCSSNNLVKNHKKSYSNENKKTDEVKDFYLSDSTKLFSAIESAKVSDEILTVSIVNKSYHEGYTAPVIVSYSVTKYEGDPLVSLIGTAATLGLPLLFFPGKTLESAFGCTDYFIHKKYISLNERKLNGKNIWVNQSIDHEIEVNGFDKSYKFKITPNTNFEYKINLTEAINKSKFSEISRLNIKCLDCNITSSEDAKFLKTNSTETNIDVDFRNIKLKIDLQEKLRLENDEKVRLAETLRQKLKLQEDERLSQIAERAKLIELERQKKIEQVEVERKKQIEREERERQQLQQKKDQLFKL